MLGGTPMNARILAAYLDLSDECNCECADVHIEDLCNNDMSKLNYDIEESLCDIFDKMLKSGNTRLTNILKDNGWANEKFIKDRDAKLSLKKTFWIISDSKIHNAGYYEVNLDSPDIPSHYIRYIAKDDTHVAQEITKSSIKKIFNKEQLKIYNQERAHLLKIKKQNEEKRKKMRERKKQKELNKAKKILQEAGELK